MHLDEIGKVPCELEPIASLFTKSSPHGLCWKLDSISGSPERGASVPEFEHLMMKCASICEKRGVSSLLQAAVLYDGGEPIVQRLVQLLERRDLFS